MKFTPYPYQVEAINAIQHGLIAQDNFLLTAPCSAGKTFIFCLVIDWLVRNNRKCLVLLDRKELISQTADRIREYLGNPYPDPVGIMCASLKGKTLDAPVVVASRQTLAPALKNGSGDLKINCLVIDEAHLFNQRKGQYKFIFDTLRSNHPAMRVFGCTATPYRKTGYIYGKDQVFEQIDHKITAEYLLKKGKIVPLKWKILQSDLDAKLDALKPTSTGELNEKQQYEILSAKKYILSIFEVHQEYCKNMKTAIFALNIQHAEIIAQLFQEHGIKAWIIHSKLKPADVSQSISEFSNSLQGIIINVGILTIGSDIPSIQAIILARRTLSTQLFFQIIGRGARLFPGKTECLVIDMCGSVLIHGNDPDNPIIQLEGKEDNKAKLKICPICESLCGPATIICPDCGFEFPKPPPPDPIEIIEKIKAGKLIDYEGFLKIDIDKIQYSLSKNGNVIASFFRGKKYIASDFLNPQHPKKYMMWKTDNYWRKLSKTQPPKTVAEFMRRQKELDNQCVIEINPAEKYPVKNIL